MFHRFVVSSSPVNALAKASLMAARIKEKSLSLRYKSKAQLLSTGSLMHAMFDPRRGKGHYSLNGASGAGSASVAADEYCQYVRQFSMYSS